MAQMTRMERLARREKGVPYGQEIEQIYSKSFIFVRFGAICVISRKATLFNPMNHLFKIIQICKIWGDLCDFSRSDSFQSDESA